MALRTIKVAAEGHLGMQRPGAGRSAGQRLPPLPLLLLLLLSVATVSVRGLETVTVVLKAGERRCIFEDVGAGGGSKRVELFVQPVAGGGSGAAAAASFRSLDVGLQVYGAVVPAVLERLAAGQMEEGEAEELFNEVVRSAEGGVEGTGESLADNFVKDFAVEDGPSMLAFCLDNSRSTFATKYVQVSVRDTPDDKSRKNANSGAPAVVQTKEEAANSDYDRLAEKAAAIFEDLKAVQEQQMRDRNRLSFHSTTQQSSHSTMVMGSIFETVVFVVASAFQIYFVRIWFQAKRRTGGGNAMSGGAVGGGRQWA